LLSSTLLNMVVIPALLAQFETDQTQTYEV